MPNCFDEEKIAHLKEELEDERAIEGIKEAKQWNLYRENLLKMK